MIVKDKDDLRVPLLLETIPTPKEFKDAIESLSPEQQRFAKGFRAMQLESTLFAVCVVQIKPQLEKLLNLPDDALTKEIELTQDLLNLFIEYQIPSDLLSFQGDPQTSAAQRVEVGAVSSDFIFLFIFRVQSSSSQACTSFPSFVLTWFCAVAGCTQLRCEDEGHDSEEQERAAC
jgi:hypothetical protein